MSHGTTRISFLGKRRCALNNPPKGPLTSTASGIIADEEKNCRYFSNCKELIETYVFKPSSSNLVPMCSAHVQSSLTNIPLSVPIRLLLPPQSTSPIKFRTVVLIYPIVKQALSSCSP